MCDNPSRIAQEEGKSLEFVEETGSIRTFEFVDCWLKLFEKIPDVYVEWKGELFYLKCKRL